MTTMERSGLVPPVFTQPEFNLDAALTQGSAMSIHINKGLWKQELESNLCTTDNDADMRATSGSPSMESQQLPPKPDISIFCPLCMYHIDLRALNDHRYYHRCLEIMRYRDVGARPDSVEGLMKRRRTILRKMKLSTDSYNPLDPVELKKLNDAYEYLKADIEDTFEAYRQIRENVKTEVSGVALNCSAKCALAVGMSSHANERWKSNMEDSRVFQDCYGNDPNKCYFGVYDGHHGCFASEMAASELHHALLMEMCKFDPRTKCTCTFNTADEDHTPFCEIHSRAPSKMSESGLIQEESASMIQKIIEESEEKLRELRNKSAGTERKKKKLRDPFREKLDEAFKKAHFYTDALLAWGKDEQSRVRWSGVSTLCCIIRDNPDASDALLQTQKESSAEEKVRKETEQDGGKEAKEESESTNLQQLGEVHIANAGNVRALLVRGNKPYRLSKDHTPDNEKEKARVIKEGGTVSESERELRVNGILAATRGIGNHGDPALKKCIISEPQTTHVKLDQYAQFLVLATAGVWEVFSDQEVASLLLQLLPANYMAAPSDISTDINNLYYDNMSQLISRSQSVNTADITAANEMGYKRMSLASGMSGTRPNSHKLCSDITLNENGSPKKNLPQGGTGSRKQSSHGMRDDASSNMADLMTEYGSHMENFSDDGSGNEADLDTITEFTLPEDFAAMRVPTREEFHREMAQVLSERLTQAAIMAGSRDNITVMVILLPGCGL